MSYVFISYKREDEVRVARIAASLESVGLEVWWDRGLPGGENWHAEINTRLDGAGCVVVVWSQASVAPEGYYVRDEARRGLERGVLVPVRIDSIRQLPLGFGEVQAIDLSRWKGDPRDPFFQDLVAAIRSKLDGVASASPKGALARVRRRLWFSGVSATTVVLLLVLAINAFGVTAKVCSLPGLQPGLSDACGAVRLGGRPNRVERLAWAALPAGECQALRDHINRFPDGAYRSQAVALLTARRIDSSPAWVRRTRSLPLLTIPDQTASASIAAARAHSLQGVSPRAEAMCRSFAASTLFRFVAASPKVEKWTCAASGPGYACGFEGRVDCSVDERQEVERETCGPRATPG